MLQQSLFEKLNISEEKNFLIQGLPSSIEKQFIKLSYSKNVTPLLKIKKIDFALVFAVNGNQLKGILNDVIPHLHIEGKLWIACPKPASKIASDLSREHNWEILAENNFEMVTQVTLDHVWTAIRYHRNKGLENVVKVEETKQEGKKIEVKIEDFNKNLAVQPSILEKVFTRHKKARDIFQNLSVSNQKEYVEWIEGAKREETRNRRLEAIVEKLLSGKKSPLEK